MLEGALNAKKRYKRLRTKNTKFFIRSLNDLFIILYKLNKDTPRPCKLYT